VRINENNLIEKLRIQSPSALEYVMDNYSGIIYGLSSRILSDLGSKEDIEECVSDIFVEIWNKGHQYNSSKGTIKTWFLIIAKYKALDYRKKLINHKDTLELDDKQIHKITEGIDQSLISKEQVKEIKTAIDSLGPPDSEIFYRRYFLYQSIEFISSCLGLTRGSVDTRLWRGRNALREKLSQKGRMLYE
jgi:RNA polymerase sigma-70 factor, ECF subfamily